MKMMTLRQYARHRGCSLSAVQKAIATGRISVAREEQHGQRTRVFVDQEDCDAGWQMRTDPGYQRNATRKEKGVVEEPVSRTAEPDYTSEQQTDLFPDIQNPHDPNSKHGQSRAETGDKDNALVRSRTVNEFYKAKTAELEYNEKLGRLVDVEAMKVAAFNAARTVQQNLLNVPARVSAEILSKVKQIILQIKNGEEVDLDIGSVEIQNIVRTEIHRSLESLADGSGIIRG